MRSITVILFLLSGFVYGQDLNYYVSMTDGDDSRSAEQAHSSATPWKTIAKLQSTITFQGDDSIFFDRGDEWKETFSPEGDGTSGHNVVITAYGTGAKPIITARDTVYQWDVAGTWTLTGTANVWKKYQKRVGSAFGRRLWINDTEEKRSKGVVRGYSDFPPTATEPWYWHTDSNYIYVYSTTNPATAFSNMEKGVARYTCISLDGNDYFTIKNLDLQYGYISLAIDDSDWIIADGCSFSGFFGTNIYATTNSTNGVIKNCTFDTHNTFISGWEAKYTEDGLKVRGNTDTWDIHDNYFKNWNHCSWNIESLDGTRIDNIKLHNNEATAPDIDYGGQCAVCYENGDGNEIYRNYIHNIPTRNQIQGENLIFAYNIIDTVNAPGFYPKSVSAGSGIYIAGLVGSSANNMLIANNVIAHCEDYGIGLVSSALYADKYDNDIINNIIFECDDTALYVSSGVTVLDNVFKNNIFCKLGVTNVISYRGTQYSVDEFNALTGDNGNTMSGNLGRVPFFTGIAPYYFDLQTISPAINAGTDVGLTEDYLEKPVPYELTDIGAFEFYGTVVTGEITFAKDADGNFMKDSDGNFMIIIN